MIYLYAYAGQPWKAQYWLRQVWTECTLLDLMVIVEMKTMDKLPPGMYSLLLASTLFVREQMNILLVLHCSKKQLFILRMAIVSNRCPKQQQKKLLYQFYEFQ